MSDFKTGEVVSFKEHGKVVYGRIWTVGSSLLGVNKADGVVEFGILKDDVLPQTPAQKAGLIIGDTVTVGEGEDCPHSFRVGDTATFFQDDRSTSPKFEQNGKFQFLDLEEITIHTSSASTGPGRAVPVVPRELVCKTPCELAGLKVGDEVRIEGHKGPLEGRTFLYRDDRSSIPKFRDDFGNTYYIELMYVTKMVTLSGPAMGVLWSEAPEGATHYSKHRHHASRWHKLDERGEWSYYNGYQWQMYGHKSAAHVEDQVAIPGVDVVISPTAVMAPVLQEVKELEAQVRAKLTTVASLEGQAAALNREVEELNLTKQERLAQIKAAGLKPSDSWESGDIVKCISTTGAGVADITIGKEYVVEKCGAGVAVIDNEGDAMRACVTRGCFKWVRSATKVIPASHWKAGQRVRNVSDTDVGYGDLKIGSIYTLTDDARTSGSYTAIAIVDDAGDSRTRSASAYELA